MIAAVGFAHGLDQTVERRLERLRSKVEARDGFPREGSGMLDARGKAMVGAIERKLGEADRRDGGEDGAKVKDVGRSSDERDGEGGMARGEEVSEANEGV